MKVEQSRKKQMTMSVCQEFMIYEGLRHVETFAMLLSTGLGATFVVFLF